LIQYQIATKQVGLIVNNKLLSDSVALAGSAGAVTAAT